jgi:hypothetical protein
MQSHRSGYFVRSSTERLTNDGDYDALIADGLTWGWKGDFTFLGWIHDELQVRR